MGIDSETSVDFTQEHPPIEVTLGAETPPYDLCVNLALIRDSLHCFSEPG